MSKTELRKISLFVSSPSDVAAEREAVGRVTERLNSAFRSAVHIRAVRWEQDYYTADKTFQAKIESPQKCDLVVCILWSRLGSELPPDFERMPDGRPYPSGTVYELLKALEARNVNERGLPDVLVYRKTLDLPTSVVDPAKSKRTQAEIDALNNFWSEHFVSREGHFLAGYHTFGTTDEFEAQFEAHLRKWLADAGLLGKPVTWPIAEKGSPFRGLEPFDVEHEQVMFGRSAEVERAIALIQKGIAAERPFLLITGESGAGKSSLARAGVIPRVMRLSGVEGADVWRLARMRPGGGADPLELLADALFSKEALPELASSDYPEPRLLRALLSRADATASLPITRTLERVGADWVKAQRLDRPVRARLVLLVDQLEELCADTIEPEAREQFAAACAALVESGSVVMVATLRADAYPLVLGSDALIRLKAAGATLDVRSPGEAQISDIVTASADAAGLSFDRDPATGKRLSTILVEAARGQDALPLLQFALQQLFDAMLARIAASGRGLAVAEADDLVLRLDDYRALGELDGAIREAAERAFGQVDRDAQARLPRLVRALLRPSDVGYTSQSAPLSEFAGDAAALRLIEALTRARILVRGACVREDGTGGVRFAHEAVQRSWPRVADIVGASATFYRVRSDVLAAFGRWSEAQKRHVNSNDFLIQPGVPLAEAEAMAGEFRNELPADILAFVARSGQRARTQQRRTQIAATLFAILFVLAGGVAVYAFQQRSAAETARERAEAAAAGERRAALEARSAQEHAEAEKSRADENAAAERRSAEAAERAARQAEISRQSVLRAQSLFWADLANRRNAEADYRRGALLALEALPANLDAPDRPFVPEAERSLVNAVTNLALGLPGITLSDHPTMTASVEASPNGDRIAVATDQNGVRLFDGRSGAELGRLPGTFEYLPGMTFSPDGRRILTWEETGGPPILFDAHSGRKVISLVGSGIRIAAFRADGRLVAMLSRTGTVTLWDTAAWKVLRSFQSDPEGDASAIAFQPKGGRILLHSLDNARIEMWDTDGRRRWEADSGLAHPHGVAFSSDGQLLVAYGSNRTVVFEAETGRSLANLDTKAHVAEASFSPDGRWLVTSGEGHAELWDLPSGGRGAEFPAYSPRFLPNGRLLFATGRIRTGSGGMQLTIQSVDVASFAKDGSGGIRVLASVWLPHGMADFHFLDDGGSLVSVGTDRTVQLWRVGDWDRGTVLVGHTGSIRALAFSSDGKHMLSASADRTARLWDLDEPGSPRVLAGHARATTAAAFSPKEPLAATGDDYGTVRFWDATTGAQSHALAVHVDQEIQSHALAVHVDQEIKSLRFSPDGDRLLTIGGTIYPQAQLWPVRGDMPIAQLDADRSAVSAAFSPDGSLIAIGSKAGTVQIADGRTGLNVRLLSGHTGPVNDVAFSPDGKHLVTGSSDQTALIWEVAEGRLLARLSGHASEVRSVAVSPDGQRAASIAGRELRLWSMPQGQLLAAASGDVGSSIAFSTDGTIVATCGPSLGVWDSTSAALLATVDRHCAAMQFQAGRSVLAVGDHNGETAILPMRRGQAAIDIARAMNLRPLSIEERREAFLPER